jgi:hypothetical protein
MVSAVGIGNSPSVSLASQSQSTSSSTNTSFQQAVNQYLSDTTTGASSTSGVSSTNANPVQTLSSDLMSSLLQLQF